MDLGDRVYAAERITKKREKRVSSASAASRRQVAPPDGIRLRAVTASLSPLPHASYLVPLSLDRFFFSSPPTAGSPRPPLLRDNLCRAPRLQALSANRYMGLFSSDTRSCRPYALTETGSADWTSSYGSTGFHARVAIG